MSDTNITALSRPTFDPFSGGLFDRAAADRVDQAWRHARLKDPISRFLPLFHLNPLIRNIPNNPELAWLNATTLNPVLKEDDNVVLLGRDASKVTLFAVNVDALGNHANDCDQPLSEHGIFVNAREICSSLPYGQGAIVAQARAVLDWHARHPFCASCGHLTRMRHGGSSRTCTNPDCARDHFPRTDPVAIMMVVDGDYALLGRPARLPEGVYTALAGFIEQGETIEEAVRREIFEEAGIYVRDVRYVQSQPWPWPSNLMIGCLGRATSADIQIDPDEIEDAQWWHVDKVRQGLQNSTFVNNTEFRLPPPIAVAHHLAHHWVGLRTRNIDPFAN